MKMEDDGWLSDESDFYGSTKLRKRLDKQSNSLLLEPFTENQYTRLVALQLEHQAGSTAPPKTEDVEMTDDVDAVGKGETFKTYGVDDERPLTDPSTWQYRSETVLDFLRRAPVLDVHTSSLGSWLWVHNPKRRPKEKSRHQKMDKEGFEDIAFPLLEAFDRQKAKTQKSNQGKAESTITRHLRPYREKLKDDIRDCAVKYGVTCGKWMLFPKQDDLARTWRIVAEATAEGKLGPTAKVATAEAGNVGRDEQRRLICIYTYDFTDGEDIERVLNQLVELGLCFEDGKPIYYKCDAYTYLNISSDNPYKLRASLYSSKDFVKAEKNGKPARSALKREENANDSFYSSLQY